MKIVIVLPVYNEELILARNIQTLLDFCLHNLPGYDFTIVIANNNSTDKTGRIAWGLSRENKAVENLFIDQKGKGLAISSAWRKYEADLYCFMDADLATDLSALPEAIREIESGAEVVIGSRFHPKSIVARSFLRRVVSQNYRWFFKILFKNKLNDFPCGFKIIVKKVRDSILENILDTGFFWDTEMLILADRKGFSIVEIPIIWREMVDENRKSHVNIIRTSLVYIKQSILLRLRLIR